MPKATKRLRDADIRYISLAGAPKNGRALILKSDLADGEAVIEGVIELVKADAARQMAYGVVYAPDDVDADGHTMSAAEIEKAMLGFMAAGRIGSVDVDHDEMTGGAYVAESWLVKGTDAGETCDALFPGEPVGTWCVGVKVEDAATWGRIEKGEITGLSFAGVAVLEDVEKGAAVVASVTEAGEPVELTKGLQTALVEFLKAKGRCPDGMGLVCTWDDEGQPHCYCEYRDSSGHKATPDAGDVAELVKSFGARMMRHRLWDTTSALGDALRELYEDGAVPSGDDVRGVLDEFGAWLLGHFEDEGALASAETMEKAGAVQLDATTLDAILAAFRGWLLGAEVADAVADAVDDAESETAAKEKPMRGQVVTRQQAPAGGTKNKPMRGEVLGRRTTSGAASAKEKPMRGTVIDVRPTKKGETRDEDLDAVREAVAGVVAPLVERLDALEKATPGRQSVPSSGTPTPPASRGLKIL